MRIKQIKLKNFKAYRDSAPIKFSCDTKKNVTLVYGVMGAGKTSFFEAINWGLYGNAVVGKGNTIKDMALVAGDYLRDELDENERGEVKVEINFEHDGADYELKRSAFYLKKNGKLNYLPGNDVVTLYIVSKDAQPEFIGPEHEDAEQAIFRRISNILPISSRQYFLFDGEKLDTFMKNPEEVQIAIRQVLGFVDIDNAKANLQTVKSEVRTKWVSLEKSTEAKQLSDTLKMIEDKKKELLLKKLEYDDEVKKKKEEFDKNEEKLQSFGIDREKIKLRGDIEFKRDRAQIDLKVQKTDLKRVLSVGYIPYSKSILIDCTKALDKWQKEGKFPAEYYNLDWIEKVIEEKKCFFWNFKENSEEHKFFLQEVQRLRNWSRTTQEQLTQYFSVIKVLTKQSEVQFSDIKDEQKQLATIYEQIEQYKSQITQISQEIKSNISIEEMKECGNKRERLDQEISEAKDNLSKTKGLMDDNAKHERLANDRLLKIQGSNTASKLERDKMAYLEQAIETIEKVHEYYTQKKREEVQKITRELFTAISWKKHHFTDVGLTEDYRLFIEHRLSKDGREGLSAGESEVLSLAFVAALAKSACQDAPFIVDTPLARISKEPTTNIASNLPDKVDQLVLFVTDKELTAEAEEILTKRAEYIWTIEFDDTTSQTAFVEGKHV